MPADSVQSTDRTTSVEEALAVVLASVARGPAEEVPLAEAAGRVLAEAVAAAEDLWPFPRAAMDGVAVRARDVAGASEDRPVALRIAGAIYSGQVWAAPLEPGTALRIATGAPVPPGADAVIPREALRWEEERVVVVAPTAAGRHVFPAGEDARAGEIVLREGTVLAGGHLGLLAALGRSVVPVVRRAEVAILATGDELVPPSAALRPGQVRESNTYALAAEVAAVGAAPRLLRTARDRAADLEAKIREGLGADALIICGGVSVGDRDLVRDALLRAGVTLKFVGVAMKPGAPVAFGLVGARPVFALPGTPGATRIAYEVLVRPALCAMLGHPALHRPSVTARLDEPLSVKPGRRRYLWGRAVLGPGGVRVVALSGQGTATLRSAGEANALIEVQPGETLLPPGSPVTVHLLTAGGLPTVEEWPRAALGVVGARGAGKTTLIERLIPALRRRGLSVAVVKHHAHMRADDGEGTDTWRAAQAGAQETVLVGPGGAVHRRPAGDDPPLAQVLAAVGHVDLVLVEGYSPSSLPKILVCREGVTGDRAAPAGPIVATVGEAPAQDAAGEAAGLWFAWDAIEDLAEFIVRRWGRR